MDTVVNLNGSQQAPFLLTCEHASNRCPEMWPWRGEDLWLRETHWAYDLGAATVTRLLSRALGLPAVLAGFTRLLIDPNRALDGDNLFRQEAEGRPVVMNAALGEQDRQDRIDLLYNPYHRAVEDALMRYQRARVLSIHSFTPHYDGQTRPMDSAVMHADDPEAAETFQGALVQRGYRPALNEPYSGKEGFMHSANQHARAFGRRALLIEIRQDLLVDSRRIGQVVADLRSIIENGEY